MKTVEQILKKKWLEKQKKVKNLFFKFKLLFAEIF